MESNANIKFEWDVLRKLYNFEVKIYGACVLCEKSCKEIGRGRLFCPEWIPKPRGQSVKSITHVFAGVTSPTSPRPV